MYYENILRPGGFINLPAFGFIKMTTHIYFLCTTAVQTKWILDFFAVVLVLLSSEHPIWILLCLNSYLPCEGIYSNALCTTTITTTHVVSLVVFRIMVTPHHPVFVCVYNAKYIHQKTRWVVAPKNVHLHTVWWQIRKWVEVFAFLLSFSSLLDIYFYCMYLYKYTRANTHTLHGRWKPHMFAFVI